VRVGPVGVHLVGEPSPWSSSLRNGGGRTRCRAASSRSRRTCIVSCHSSESSAGRSVGSDGQAAAPRAARATPERTWPPPDSRWAPARRGQPQPPTPAQCGTLLLSPPTTCPSIRLPPGLGTDPSIRPPPGLTPPPRAARRPIAVPISAGGWGGRRPGRASSLLTAHGKPGGGPFESVKRLDPTLRSSYRSPRPLQSRARGGHWHDTGRIPQAPQAPLGGMLPQGQSGPSGPVEGPTAPSLATGRGCYLQSPSTTRHR